jgi:hypothetical protein
VVALRPTSVIGVKAALWRPVSWLRPKPELPPPSGGSDYEKPEWALKSLIGLCTVSGVFSLCVSWLFAALAALGLALPAFKVLFAFGIVTEAPWPSIPGPTTPGTC